MRGVAVGDPHKMNTTDKKKTMTAERLKKIVVRKCMKMLHEDKTYTGPEKVHMPQMKGCKLERRYLPRVTASAVLFYAGHKSFADDKAAKAYGLRVTRMVCALKRAYGPDLVSQAIVDALDAAKYDTESENEEA
jgi:hypothetical protein